MDPLREQFLAGERPEDVLLYLAENAVSDLGTLAEHGEQVSGGVALILDGERGRSAFEAAAGVDPMALAGAAMEAEGEIDLVNVTGRCPEGSGAETDSETHAPRFAFAFAEEENHEAGGLYAEGDVIHAYALCECETAYSDRWVAAGSD